MVFVCLCFLLCCCSCENDSNIQPKISVIVPIYNQHPWISKCLKSILNQTLKDIEIICVDDGSVDKSLQIINSFSENDNRIVVIHQENCGLSCARNSGLRIARGEYISFVDSDDWIEPDMLDFAYGRMKEDEHIDVVVWGFYMEKSNNPKYYGPSADVVLHGIDSARYLLPKPDINVVWNKLYRRSLLVRSGVLFDTTVKYSEDIPFNFDLVPFVNDVVCVKRAFYHYLFRPSGLNTVRPANDLDGLSEAIIRHWNALKGNARFMELFAEEGKEMREVKALADGFRKQAKDKRTLRKRFWLFVSLGVLVYVIVMIGSVTIVRKIRSRKNKKK